MLPIICAHAALAPPTAVNACNSLYSIQGSPWRPMGKWHMGGRHAWPPTEGCVLA